MRACSQPEKMTHSLMTLYFIIIIFLKIMGVTLDSALSFNKHVSDVVCATSFHLRALKHVRKVVDKPTANVIACCVLGSRLDYCNSVLAGMSNCNIKRLQRVQHFAARTVANAHSRSSVSCIMKDLHWLSIHFAK